MKNRTAKILSILLLHVNLLLASTYVSQRSLRQALFSEDRYDPFVPPVNDTNDMLKISMYFAHSPSIELDESIQVMSGSYWFRLSWQDQLIQWNQDDYNGIDRLAAHPSSLWKPKISLSPILEEAQLTPRDDDVIFVDSRGAVTFSKSFNAKTRCVMDISKFPFDVQICAFTFMIDYYTTREVSFDNIELADMKEPESQWLIIHKNMSIGKAYRMSTVNVEFTLKRQASFYVITIIIPLMATALLNPVVFLIPPSSGEKVSVAVTILLSYTVFLNVVSSILPESATSVSILSVYIATLQVLSGLYTILCALIVKMNGDSALKWNLDLCSWFRPRKKRIDVSREDIISKFEREEKKPNPNLSDKLFRLCCYIFFVLAFLLTLTCFYFILET